MAAAEAGPRLPLNPEGMADKTGKQNLMSLPRPIPKISPALVAKVDAIRADILDEYLKPHGFPWIIGFSGGKDSTLVAHLVFDMLASLAPNDRRRDVHLVSNDTLVESPLVISHIANVQEEIERA